MDSTTLSVRLPQELKERLGDLAERTRRSKSFLAVEAIAGYVDRELEIVAAIERGLDDMKAGRVVSHDQAMGDIRKHIDDVQTSR